MKRLATLILVLVGLGAVFLIGTAESCDQAASDLSGENNTYTLAQYNKVKNGMSVNKVDKIMGGGGTNSASSKVGGVKVESYNYANPDGSNAEFSFTNGKLDTKAQFGLE